MPSNIVTPGGCILKFVSWNVKSIKRGKVMHHLKHLGAQIIFLQEMHVYRNMQVLDHVRLRKGWKGQVFHSSFNGRARGVAILINKSVPFILKHAVSDPNGRYVVVTGTIYEAPLALVNMYGPNWDNVDFFRRLFSSLPDMTSFPWVLGGDFNCWLDPVLNRFSKKISSPSKAASLIKIYIDELAISDPWRFMNPSSKVFSFFSTVHHTFSRIDYFQIDNRLLPLVQNCAYNTIIISDHAPVTMGLLFEKGDNSRSPWRLNP